MAAEKDQEGGAVLAKVLEPWRVKYYEHVCIRLSGIIFTRYLTRIIIKLASSLCFLITSYFQAPQPTPFRQI